MLTITSHHKSASSLQAEHLLLDTESVQALLGPLILTHGSHFQLVHQSLKHYLTTLPRGIQDDVANNFGIDRKQDQKTVFQACSVYLSLDDC